MRVFNSPGCGELAGSMVKTRMNYINNINARYGIVNKIGMLVGKLFVIDIAKDEAEAKLLYEHFDKKDFDESIALERVGSKELKGTSLGFLANLKGQEERIASIAGSVNAVATSASTQHSLIICEKNSVLNNWQHLTSLATKAFSCEASAFTTAPASVLFEQHTIDNIVSTLEEAEYKHLANSQI
jgi:hypothetical protein